MSPGSADSGHLHRPETVMDRVNQSPLPPTPSPVPSSRATSQHSSVVPSPLNNSNNENQKHMKGHGHSVSSASQRPNNHSDIVETARHRVLDNLKHIQTQLHQRTLSSSSGTSTLNNAISGNNGTNNSADGVNDELEKLKLEVTAAQQSLTNLRSLSLDRRPLSYPHQLSNSQSTAQEPSLNHENSNSVDSVQRELEREHESYETAMKELQEIQMLLDSQGVSDGVKVDVVEAKLRLAEERLSGQTCNL